jgi:hypothetical protein
MILTGEGIAFQHYQLQANQDLMNYDQPLAVGQPL